MRYTIFTLLFLFVASISSAQDRDEIYTVKYLSAENIYIDGGKSDSLMIGDKLLIKRNEKTIAEVEINYLSGNSASCNILTKNDEIKVGDQAVMFEAMPRPKKNKQPIKLRKKRVFQENTTSQGEKKIGILSGYVALQSYIWKDNSSNQLNFFQPSARLNFRLQKLWGYKLNFKMHLRSVYNQRLNVINPSLPAKEWQHRLYEISFDYKSLQERFGFKIGRILNNYMSGVGFIDGLQLHYKIYDNLTAGIFGGAQPEWEKGDFGLQIKKYGLYLNYIKGNYSRFRFESTIAASGEYTSKTVSREYLYLYTNISSNGAWSLYQSMQLDYNGSWRADSSNNSVQISNLYIMGTYNVLNDVRLTLSYDTRNNYRTILNRNIPNNLFDQEIRHGLRTGILWFLPNNYKIYGSFGIRLRKVIDNSYSYSATFSNSNFSNLHLKLKFRLNGFDNQFGSGYNPGVSIGKTVWNGSLLYFSYGLYYYSIGNNNITNSNQWIRINSEINLTAGFYGSLQYEYDWGADLTGHRSYCEIGWRF